MNQSATLAVVGGDIRQAYLAGLLCADGTQYEPLLWNAIRSKGVPLLAICEAVLPMCKRDPAAPRSAWNAQLNAPLSNIPIRC